MRKIVLLLFFSLPVITLLAQRDYYIYLQSENQVPFFVKMNDRLFSSASSGYLILSRLKDTTQYFSVGFPGQNLSLPFYVTVNHKDHGFLLKNFGEKGWGLFDLETMGIQMASRLSAGQDGIMIVSEKKEANAFTSLLSKAVNDSTLNQKIVIEEKKPAAIPQPVVKKDSLTEEKKPEVIVKAPGAAVAKPGLPAPLTDTALARVEEPGILVEKKEIPGKTAPSEVPENTGEKKEQAGEGYTISVVTKKSQILTGGGANMVFIDEMPGGIKDTIRILIPAAQKAMEKSTAKDTTTLKFLNVFPEEGTKKEEQPAKTGCEQQADNTDFLALRKEMAGESTDAAMLAKARYAFSKKCYSTEQIKNLGNLFLDDKGKMAFYQLAWEARHITDPNGFSALEAELKEENYKQAFRQLMADPQSH